MHDNFWVKIKYDMYNIQDYIDLYNNTVGILLTCGK